MQEMIKRFDPELEVMLDKWFSGNECVTSVEMGGIGTGYEQCIQILAFQFLDKLVDLNVIPEALQAVWPSLYEKHLEPILSGLNSVYGYTGAQVSAACNLAFNFYVKGVDGTLKSVPSDRLIVLRSKFPVFDLKSVRVSHEEKA